MDQDLKDSMTSGETWTRGLYMLLFSIIYSVAEAVLVVTVILQFVFVLISRAPNTRLQEFSDDLSIFIYQVLQFVTFNSDEKPFPFAPWPYGEGGPDWEPPMELPSEAAEPDTDTHTEAGVEDGFENDTDAAPATRDATPETPAGETEAESADETLTNPDGDESASEDDGKPKAG